VISRHLMLLPSLACQASCAYCFGPNRGPTMPSDVFDATVFWIVSISPIDESLDITFHGGEPLLAGRKWYERNLPVLRRRFGNRLKLHVQSNLWLLNDGYCALFREYGVSLGASLDGPEPINDRQRGEGYFAQTMSGIETARRHDLDVGVICTFTRLSAPHYREVLDFFIAEHLSFSVHAAISAPRPGARHLRSGFGVRVNAEDSCSDLSRPVSKCLAPHTPKGDGLAMSPEEHVDLFVQLFDAYDDPRFILCHRGVLDPLPY
jgi:sulfatase maturation enzyme AslB (radical SAM superfamily)